MRQSLFWSREEVEIAIGINNHPLSPNVYMARSIHHSVILWQDLVRYHVEMVDFVNMTLCFLLPAPRESIQFALYENQRSALKMQHQENSDKELRDYGRYHHEGQEEDSTDPDA